VLQYSDRVKNLAMTTIFKKEKHNDSVVRTIHEFIILAIKSI
jgi:hypothetical protein